VSGATTHALTGDVLVVHADPHFAEQVVRALRGHGLDAERVGDGEHAIDRFVQRPARALVVGAELPGRDGAATVESIRWAPGGARVPIVLAAEAGSAAKLSDTGRRLGAATLHGPDARDAELVARLVRRALGSPPPAPVPRDTKTVMAIAATHTSPTLSALGEPPRGGAHLDDEDDTLAPLPAASRIRETVATDTRSPAFTARADEHGRSSAAPDDTDFHRGDDPDAEREGRVVDRHAAEVTPGAAAHTGRFAELSFPRVLARLAAERATGALVIVAPDDDAMRTTTGESPKKVVYFRNGVPVYVRSNLVRECLGQLLVASDLITPHARNQSVQRMRAGEGRQGAILLAMGALTPQQLRDALEEQLRVKLFDLFRWDDAEFRFTSRVAQAPEIVTLELGLAEIVFEGVVRGMTPARLLTALEPKLDDYVVPMTEQMTRFVRLDLVAEARHVLRNLDGTRRLRELFVYAGQRPGAAAQLVYAMECLGAVRFSDLPVPVGRLDGEASDVLRVDDDTAALHHDEATSRGPIAAFRGGLASPTEGRDALGTARLPRPPEGLLPVAAPRAAAAEPRPRVPAPARHAPEANDWDDETSEVSSTAHAAWLLGSPPQPATPRATSLPTTHDIAPPRAAAVTSRPPAQKPVDAQPAEAQPAEAPPVATDPPAASLDARIERIAEAERHCRRGERALARNRLDDALTAFARAAELVPDDAEFAARLAHTRLLAGPIDAGLTRECLSALERAASLTPGRALPHLLLADARERHGDVRGARDAFEDALTADPNCHEALERLRSLQPRATR
jgi:CheY-like chemotaxis protein